MLRRFLPAPPNPRARSVGLHKRTAPTGGLGSCRGRVYESEVQPNGAHLLCKCQHISISGAGQF